MERVTLGCQENPVCLEITPDVNLTNPMCYEDTKMKIFTSKKSMEVKSKTRNSANINSSIMFAYRRIWLLSLSGHNQRIRQKSNDIKRIITGYLRRPIKVDNLYFLSRIAAPEIRRKLVADLKRTKWIQDSRHLLHVM